MDKDFKDLIKLYRDRLKDKRHLDSKRRRKIKELPESVGNLFPKYFGNTKVFGEGDGSHAIRKMEEQRLFMAWGEILGEPASRMSRAVKVRTDTLIVEVADPLWMQQLSLLKQDILKKIRARFPALGIRNIFFVRELSGY